MLLPELIFDADPAWPVPDERNCLALWDKYGVLPHIRAHCRTVAAALVFLTDLAAASGRVIRPDLARAAGLLHDLAKTYTVNFSGSHEQLGAAWLAEDTGNPALAQAVLFHVRWPWDRGPLAWELDPLRLPILLSYADKRVRHDRIVSLDERYEDLLSRYGKTEIRCYSIMKNMEMAKAMEKALFSRLGTFDLRQASVSA